MTTILPGSSRRAWGAVVAAAFGLGAAVAGLGLHTVTAAAASSVSCSSAGGEPEIFYVGGDKGNAGQCAIIEPSNGVILPGDTIGAVYTDERDINKTGGTVNGKQTSAPTFTVDGVAQNPVTLTYHPGSKWIYDVTITVPSVGPGDHTAVVSAWDGDQNKNGGDFGQVTFHFTTSDGSIGITPQSATNPVGHQHVFTVTANASPGSASDSVSFGAITWSVSPTPSSLSSNCDKPTVSGNTATCTITINSSSAGTFTANAAVTMTIGGETVNRSTDGKSGPHGSGGTGPAVKTYVAPSSPAGGVQGLQTPAPTAAVKAITATPNTGADIGLPLGGLALLTAGAGLIGWALRRSRS